METPEITLKVLAHIAVIFGWFWLITWTIIRIGMFKKRVFSFLIFIYFSQGVAKASELVTSNLTLNKALWIYEFTNILLILGFFCLSNRLIYIKSKLKNYEKSDITD